MRNLTEATTWLKTQIEHAARCDNGVDPHIPSSIPIDFVIITGEEHERPCERVAAELQIVNLADRKGYGETEADAYDELANDIATELVRKYKFMVNLAGEPAPIRMGVVLQRHMSVTYEPLRVIVQWKCGTYRVLPETNDE
jgi:hypothetical protein